MGRGRNYETKTPIKKHMSLCRILPHNTLTAIQSDRMKKMELIHFFFFIKQCMSIEAHNLNSFMVGTLTMHTQRMNKTMEGGTCTIRSLHGLVICPFS